MKGYLVAIIIANTLISPVYAQHKSNLAQRGAELVTQHCARCHAIGRNGNSPHALAPAFRTLAGRYPIDDLQEGLVEGFSSGHPDMPEFVFRLEEAGAIIAYLKSIQER
jgi:mono/diheme cytochrome c family protein